MLGAELLATLVLPSLWTKALNLVRNAMATEASRRHLPSLLWVPWGGRRVRELGELGGSSQTHHGEWMSQ